MLVKYAWTMFGICCLGLWLIPSVHANGEPPHTLGPISLSEIRHAIYEGRGHLRNLQVEGSLTSRGRRSGQWIKQRLRITFAAAGDQRYSDVIHVVDGAGEDLDEHRNQTYLVGDEMQTFFPLQRRCERLCGAKVHLHAHIVRAHFFLECLGWWPPGDETTPTKRGVHPFFLHEAIATSAYRLRDEPESIDGVPCLVVENPNVEKLWFDPGRKFALRRREWYAAQGGTLSVRYDLSEYKEMAPGIWLPRILRRVVYARRGVALGTEPPVETETTGQIDRLIVNQVSPNVFRFQPPPGTLVWNRDSDENWQTPGGLSWLDDVIQVVKTRNERRAALAVSTSRHAVRPGVDQYVLLAVICLLIALDVYLLYNGLWRGGRIHKPSIPQPEDCLEGRGKR